MEYDADGNLKSVTTSGLDVDINTYQGGNLIKTVTGSQGIFEYTYDSTYKHRLTSVTHRDPDNTQDKWITQTMGYDDVGNVTSTTLTGPDNATMSTAAQYTSQGNLLSSITDATGASVTYSYTDEDGNPDLNSIMMGLPTYTTAPNGTTTHTTYDIYGRVAETEVAGLATLCYTYQKGTLTQITRSYQQNDTTKSQVYTIGYDDFGNTTSVSVGTRVLATYQYSTNNGLLHTQTYGNGHQVKFTYDNLGRVKTAVYSLGENVQSNPEHTRTLTYSYTGDGQLHSITDNYRGTTTVYLYQYDTLGNLVGSEKYVNGTSVLRTFHSYDTSNRVSTQGWQIGKNVFTQTYAYDDWDGNLSSISLSGNGNTTISYSYDGLRRLEKVNNGIFTATYVYQNSTTENQTTPRLASIVYKGNSTDNPTICSSSYQYDVNGNIISATIGNYVYTYEYDSNNQLIRENNPYQQYTQTWQYDAFGNIICTTKYAYTTTTTQNLLYVNRIIDIEITRFSNICPK